MISSFFLQIHGFFATFLSYPESPYFPIMSVIDATTVRWSEAQLRPRRPRTEMATPLASTASSTSVSSSSAGGATLEAIMDARLDTLSDDLCQVNTRIGCIAQQQAVMGGFTIASSPSPPVSEDESDDGSGSDDANEDDGASSPNGDEIST